MKAKNKTKDKSKKIISIVVPIIICLIAEIVLSNFTAISLVLSGSSQRDIDLSTVRFLGDGEAVASENMITLHSKNTIQFDDIECEMKNICVQLSGAGQYLPVEIRFTDDNFRYESGFDYNVTYTKFYAGEQKNNYCSITSYGNLKDLRIVIGDFSREVTISGVSVNKPPEFHISVFRLLVIIGAFFVIKLGLWKVKLGDKGNSVLIAAVSAVACAAVLFLTVGVAVSTEDISLLEECGENSVCSDDGYTQLFRAFLNGHTYLDVDYDLTKFEGTENIYDRSERNLNNIHGAFWDRAYYNGKIYLYFGAVPVITVYYPVYILTGKAPHNIFVTSITCCYAVVFLALLYNLLIQKFCEKTPSLLVVLGYIALLFSSLIFAYATEGIFYYSAVLSGIASVAAFLYFMLKAYYTEKKKLKIIFLVLMGLSVVAIAGSRPTLILYCFTALVPIWLVFKDKKIAVKDKLTYLVSLAVPVAIGAALIMYYNFVRFENPFEFGFNYQLTVSIAAANTVTLSMLPATVYHYFLQPPRVTMNFPYIEMKSYSMDAYTRYNYCSRTLGAFNYPVMWGVFLLPFARIKKDKFKFAFISSTTAALFILAFIDMCKAGSHYRYTGDIFFALALVSLVVIFNFMSDIKDKSEKDYAKIYVFVVIAMMVTITVGYLMLFATDGGKLMGSYPSIAEFFRSL